MELINEIVEARNFWEALKKDINYREEAIELRIFEPIFFVGIIFFL